MNKKFWLVIIGVLIIKFLFHSFWDYFYTYDHNRNLLVVESLVEQGTFSYLGRNFITNPPLYYFFLSFFAVLFGVSHFVLQLPELLAYFFGSLIICLIARELFDSDRISLIVFLIAFLNPSSLLIEALDFIAFSFLFSSLIFLAYFRFIKKPVVNNSLLLGLVIGSSLLVKSSFLVPALLILIHQLIVRKNLKQLLLVFSIAFITYLPWLIYLSINSLPLPWVAHSGEVTGKLGWSAGEVVPFYHGVTILLINWPVLFLIALLSVFIKSSDERVNFIKLFFVSVPIIFRLILSYFSLDHFYFIFPSIPLLVGFFIKHKSFFDNLVFILIIFSFILISYPIISHGLLVTSDYCDGLFNYVESLNSSVSVLTLEDLDYSLFELISEASFEQSGLDANSFSRNALLVDADLVMTKSLVFEHEPINHFSCSYKGVPSDFYFFEVLDKPEPVIDLLVLSDGEPVPNAFIIFELNSTSLLGKTKNDGSYSYRLSDEVLSVNVMSVGFSNQTIINPKGQLIINLTRLPWFIVGPLKLIRY